MGVKNSLGEDHAESNTGWEDKNERLGCVIFLAHLEFNLHEGDEYG